MATIQMVFSARLIDGNGRSRACTSYYSIGDTATFSAMIGVLEEWANDISGVSDASITDLSLTVKDPAYAVHKTAGSPIEQTGVFNFGATGTNKRWGQAIPALSDSVLVGDRIDLTHGSVITLVNDWSNGQLTNDHGQFLTTLVDTFVSFRRDRKQLQRASLHTA